MSIKFADIAEKRSVMRCERNVIILTLLQLSCLVHSLGNCTITHTCTVLDCFGMCVSLSIRPGRPVYVYSFASSDIRERGDDWCQVSS